MSKTLVFLTIPGLRQQDLSRLPALQTLFGSAAPMKLQHSFPAVTWPSQATMLTGKRPGEHGVVANGFFWRDSGKVEMWTAWNEKILAPQIWDLLHQLPSSPKSAAWFPMLSKGSGADYICMPAPIHKPDGSEELWCYTRPQEFYGELKEKLGHFPLQHFWGPLANIKSTQWIAQSVSLTAERFKPQFLYIYLPHLDYAAQKLGPDSPAALTAVDDMNTVLAQLIASMQATYGQSLDWLIASEYVITPVDHVTYPNRVLREAGLLKLDEQEGREYLNPAQSDAWALVDHQFSHVFVKNRDAQTTARVKSLFAGYPGIERVLVGAERAELGIDHERAGDVVLVSTANSWQAYYWWNDDSRAPSFARSVDIHRKPGYDPVELHVDMATRSIPLDATLIKGSHGAICQSSEQQGLMLTTLADRFTQSVVADVDLCPTLLRWFSE